MEPQRKESAEVFADSSKGVFGFLWNARFYVQLITVSYALYYKQRHTHEVFSSYKAISQQLLAIPGQLPKANAPPPSSAHVVASTFF